MKTVKKCEITNKRQFKKGALPFELHMGHADHHILFSINKSGDEWVSEQDLEKASTELWRDTDLFWSIRISSQKQHPHSSVSSCCCPLRVRVCVIKRTEASYMGPSLSDKIEP